MDVGAKIKKLRLKNGLTLEELANRCELSKGFLSQLERDKTTTSIQTLLDLLEVLGTSPKDFFDEHQEKEKIVFKPEDNFEQEHQDYTISWLVASAQKNQMEPILLNLKPKSCSNIVPPFEGEAFGYVLKGKANLIYEDKSLVVTKGDSFYLHGEDQHYLDNTSNSEFTLLWVVTPPIF